MIVDRTGRVTWSFGSASGPDRLAKPSLAVRWPNGLIAANDDYNHRVIVIDPKTKRIVWQYGHTGVSGSGAGYLSKPDGLDLLPATDLVRAAAAAGGQAGARRARRARRLAAPARLEALGGGAPGGRVLALGGLVGGSLVEPGAARQPGGSLRRVGSLPVPTHDAAAALVGGRVVPVRRRRGGLDRHRRAGRPRLAERDRAGSLGEPLSDLGAATVRRHGRISSAATPARGTRPPSCASGRAHRRSW